MLSDNLKKRIAIKNLENSYQDRQTSAKSRNLLFKFKDFQLFLAGALSQLIFLNVFLTQYAVCQQKKRIAIKNLETNYQDRQIKAGILSSNLWFI
jgi:hypothetical protein